MRKRKLIIIMAAAIVLMCVPCTLQRDGQMAVVNGAYGVEFDKVEDKPAPFVDVTEWAVALCKVAEQKAIERIAATAAVEEEPVLYAEQAYTDSGYDHDLKTAGVVRDGDTTYTWYSQNVLPGGGLDIPGRHVDGSGFVCDGDGNICVANSDLPRGTVVQTPWGQGCVYDTGPQSGTTDIYTAW